jgi:hypothetical protein
MPETTTFRFTDEDSELIERLRAALSGLAIGRTLTTSDIMRHALRALGTQMFGNTPADGGQKKKKKPQNNP